MPPLVVKASGWEGSPSPMEWSMGGGAANL